MSGNQTNVLMKPAAGVTVPSVLHSDGVAIFPDASGQFLVPATSVMTMIGAGFQIVVSGGTTHIP
jgi:hypothetical protein